MDLSLATSRFFDYMKEREAIRLRKEADRLACENFDDPQGPPWTDDPILREYKFTNVRRYHDKTSDMLRTMFYSDHFYDDKASILMNCALYRYFGTYEFAEAVGWYDYDDFDLSEIEDCATDRFANKERVFTGAYVITNQGISAPKQEVVCHHFLSDLHKATPALLEVVQKTRSWRDLVAAMASIKGFGGTGFMSKEILLDTMMTGFWGGEVFTFHDRSFTLPADYEEWTPVGPGGMRGAARLLGHEDPKSVRLGKGVPMDVIMAIYNAQKEFWPAENGKLYPTDIQFQMCEFDKYERVRLGQGKPRSRYRPT